jgi:hypothetical protein
VTIPSVAVTVAPSPLIFAPTLVNSSLGETYVSPSEGTATTDHPKGGHYVIRRSNRCFAPNLDAPYPYSGMVYINNKMFNELVPIYLVGPS